MCIWSFHPEAEASNLCLTLGDNEVHVWCASLDVEASYLQHLQQVLTTDEQNRGDRFYFQQDREHFIVARGLLRIILSRYLNTEPDRLQFCYGSKGKPALEPSLSKVLCFNLSHSHGKALYAIASRRDVGVDLELIKADLSILEIAERFFSPREYAVLLELDPPARQQAFFTYWTLKEAYIKARGEGLSIGLNQFDVSLVPGEATALLRTAWDIDEAQRWSLYNLTPALGYAAALVVEGDRPQLSCWQWWKRQKPGSC